MPCVKSLARNRRMSVILNASASLDVTTLRARTPLNEPLPNKVLEHIGA